MGKKQVLGKGLASLIQSSGLDDHPPPHSGPMKEKVNNNSSQHNIHTQLQLVDLSLIDVNTYQPRKIFHEKELLELTESIKHNGIIQPILVREKGKRFEIIAGERRMRAAKMAGIKKIPVLIKQATEKERLAMAIIENVQRSNLNVVEEAMAYQNLLNEYKMTQEEVAKKVGKERSSVTNFLRILRLPKSVLEFLISGELTFGHAKILVSMKNIDDILKWSDRIRRDSLSVRDFEKALKTQGSSSASNAKTHSQAKPLDFKWDMLRQNIENHTGLHVEFRKNTKGKGQFLIHFTNDNELNQIYELFMK